MIFSKPNGIGSSSLGVGSSGDCEQVVSPYFYRKIGSDLALDGVAKLAFC
jgi:hypothetical protein